MKHTALDGNAKTQCCEAPAKRNEQYDAYYCTKCYEWIEKKCSMPDCDFCTSRPLTAK